MKYFLTALPIIVAIVFAAAVSILAHFTPFEGLVTGAICGGLAGNLAAKIFLYY